MPWTGPPSRRRAAAEPAHEPGQGDRRARDRHGPGDGERRRSPGERRPGIYDNLLPILAQWKAAYNFVGSYYIDIGNNAAQGQTTDWAYSKVYYDQIAGDGQRDRLALRLPIPRTPTPSPRRSSSSSSSSRAR